MQTVKFSELPIADYILEAVQELGFEEATPIQAQAIPLVATGVDVIGQAQTGTGKTAAFGIPAIERVDVNERNTQVLIMCPTRELALQVKEQIYKLSKFKNGILVSAIYGGESYEKQFRDLKKGAHIVVGTPGRIIDHIERKTLNLSNLKMLILDEADEMLNMGFREDIEKILSSAPGEQQTLLFSATMSKDILNIANRFQKSPEIIKVTRNEITNDNIQQSYYAVRRDAKTEVMCRLIELHNLQLILVFSNTKAKVDEVVQELHARGYSAEGLHGDLRQTARNQVMAKFRKGVCSILVATDVAARGIDVNDVDAVFNYDVPLDIENYVHRIGRTGRAGKQGMALSLVTNRDKGKLRELERYTKVSIPEGKIPTLADLKGIQKQKLKQSIIDNITEEVDGEGAYDHILEELKEEGYYTHQILNSLLKMNQSEVVTEFQDDNLGEKSRSRDDRSGRGRERDRGGREGRDRGPRGERDRGPRGEREFGKRKEHRGDRGGKGSGEAGMVRLFLNLGRKDHISPNHIVGAISSESQIPGKVIGQIDIYDAFSFIEVPERDVNKVMSGMKGKTINAREANLELAK
ncbi:ATP-dependent RNA helicase DeaD [Spirosomataceae bacterium TFI 002]|nr:ATP-dependent RNA helicase DeaD [Spirosomataceae bacterium TFI 002]